MSFFACWTRKSIPIGSDDYARPEVREWKTQNTANLFLKFADDLDMSNNKQRYLEPILSTYWALNDLQYEHNIAFE